ncbi:MAG: hypothetical protein LBJ32_02885 [Oscillospiraceae bacterium]|nr:hypothetical protein [Oscillospiraceae bacterium]
MFRNFPSNIGESLRKKFPNYYNRGTLPYRKTNYSLGPSLLSELTKENQNKQPQSFPKTKKEIIILCNLFKKIDLMKKLFGEETDCTSKKLRDENGFLLSIKHLSSVKYNVEAIQEAYLEGYFLFELPYLWEYINNTQSFDIVLIIFDPSYNIDRIYEQISKWLCFFETFKSQNIKPIITFIKQESPTSALEHDNIIRNIKLAEYRIKTKLGVPNENKLNMLLKQNSNGCFYCDNHDHMAEFLSKMDIAAAINDAQE